MEKHVKKWLERGYIDEKQAEIIIADVNEEKKKSSRLAMNITLYTIGAILIGIGAISFIAANDWILRLFYSRFAKISASIFVTFGCFALGYWFSYVKTGFQRLGNVLIFLSTLLIGGVWALIGQIYNLHTNSNCGIFLLWFVSVLPVAYLFRKKSINNLSILLFIMAYFSIPDIYSFTYLTPIVFGLILYNFANIPAIRHGFTDFTPAYKAVSTVILYFTFIVMICVGSISESFNTIPTLAVVVMAAFLIFILLNFVLNKEKDTLLKSESAILAGIAIFGILLNIGVPGSDALTAINITGSSIILGSIILTLYHFGYKTQNTGLITRANYFTLIYISVLYFKISYHLLDKALFFFLGGTILLSLGIYLERQKKNIAKQSTESQGNLGGKKQ